MADGDVLAGIQQINQNAQWFIDYAGETLGNGQIAWLSDNSGQFKKGDGVTTIGVLPWLGGTPEWGNITGDINDQTDLISYVTDQVTPLAADIAFLQTEIDGKQDTLGFTPENVANKVNDLTDPTSTTKYTSVKAVVDALALKANINPRVYSEASNATPVINIDLYDQHNITALAAAATISAPTGTAADGRKIIYRFKDNGTARALAFNAAFRFSSDLAAPTTTVISKTLYMGFIYNAADSKWDNIAQLNNF